MVYFVKTVVSLFLQAQQRKSSSSEDDAHSRLMPGRTVFVTIKKNVHKQKRFLLCNLHELYGLFKDQNPVLKILTPSKMVAEELFCYISDDLEHDTEFRFEMQRKLVQILKKVPIVTEVDFFSDGCAKLQDIIC